MKVAACKARAVRSLLVVNVGRRDYVLSSHLVPAWDEGFGLRHARVTESFRSGRCFKIVMAQHAANFRTMRDEASRFDVGLCVCANSHRMHREGDAVCVVRKFEIVVIKQDANFKNTAGRGIAA